MRHCVKGFVSVRRIARSNRDDNSHSTDFDVSGGACEPRLGSRSHILALGCGKIPCLSADCMLFFTALGLRSRPSRNRSVTASRFGLPTGGPPCPPQTRWRAGVSGCSWIVRSWGKLALGDSFHRGSSRPRSRFSARGPGWPARPRRARYECNGCNGPSGFTAAKWQ